MRSIHFCVQLHRSKNWNWKKITLNANINDKILFIISLQLFYTTISLRYTLNHFNENIFYNFVYFLKIFFFSLQIIWFFFSKFLFYYKNRTFSKMNLLSWDFYFYRLHHVFHMFYVFMHVDFQSCLIPNHFVSFVFFSYLSFCSLFYYSSVCVWMIFFTFLLKFTIKYNNFYFILAFWMK